MLAGFTIASLIVAACNSSTPSTSPSAAAATPGAAATPTAAPSLKPGEIADIPRNKTVVFTPWGPVPEIGSSDNWNPLITGGSQNQGDFGKFGIYEALFYRNLNSGELVPWLGESYDFNADFTQLTIKIRDGVTWCDGVKFTADDVKYTLEMLRDNAPDLTFSSIAKDVIKEVQVPDPLTAVIVLNRPDPRFMTLEWNRHDANNVIVPKHIFESQDPKTFTNFDLAAGAPCGTGPYRIVRVSPQQVIADRRATWWGSDTGFSPMPAPERLIMVPGQGLEAVGQMYQANEIDFGAAPLPGQFEAIKANNPKVVSWNANGPIWGAPDGCVLDFILNNQSGPTADRNVRLAINYAIDRQKISDGAYEGANFPAILPFSSYWTERFFPGEVQALLDKYDRGTPSQAKVDQYMAASGYAKNADGKWAKDGEVLVIPTMGQTGFAPLGPPILQMLTDAGFESSIVLDPPWGESISPGTFVDMFLVHCGSASEPFDTLTDFNGKWVVPQGEQMPHAFAWARYSNPEMDKLLNEMEKIQADFTPGSAYMKLAVAATDIWLQDMPEIMIAEELHAVAFNTEYWTGWPSSSDPYVAPYEPWNAFYLSLFHIKPTGS